MCSIKVVYSKLFLQYKEIKFGFSTKLGGVSPEPYNMNLSFDVGDEHSNVIENRKKFFESLQIGLYELAIPEQIQGSTVRRVYVSGRYKECDGLITNADRVFLTISVADCLAVFIYDPVRKAIGAVHSGWRGSLQNVVKNAVIKMKDEFETNPSDLVVYVSPAAGICCYEVGDEVAIQFDSKYLTRKSRLDLKLYTKEQLIKLGVIENHIEVSEACTICNHDLFHSYRRDGGKSGRMIGVIGLVE